MKIIVAKSAGFCMGVKRAVDLALENAGRAPGGIKTIGPLIHNRQTVDMLRQRRVTELDEKNAGTGKLSLLVRAHGIPPETQGRYANQGHDIIDGTCPKVKTVHKVIERYRSAGYQIVITGDTGHAEVIGLLGYAGSAGHLINTEADVDSLPDFEKVCLVSQTTFDRTAFDRIAARVRARYASADVVVKKTICAATETRQSETEALARQVEAMIVVGGKNSANTARLAKISNDCGTPTQQVETEEEIDWKAIARCKTVGVTAGASTPNWMIKRITDYLQLMDQTQKYTPYNLARRSFGLALNVNLFVALGAVAAYYVSCQLLGLQFSWPGGILAFLYFFSMYLWNSMTSLETTQHLGLSRYRFYAEHRLLLFALAGLSIASLLLISLFMGKKLFLLMVFAAMAGSAYHMTIVPKSIRQVLRYKNLKDIPASRDLFIALAWSTVLTFIPLTMNGMPPLNPLLIITCFGWIFILAFLRSLIFDLRDIEGDRIMGRETLITIVGEKRARKAIYLIIWLCAGLSIAVPWAAGLETYHRQSELRFLSQIPALLYAALFIRWNPRLKSSAPFLFNIMADGPIYLAGLGAFCSALILGN